MGINIFNVNEENADGQVSSSSNDVAGRFRSGYQVDDRPVGLTEWRVTTGDPEVAEAIATFLGAEEPVSKWETKTGEDRQVFTTSNKVNIIVEPKSVKATLVLWGQGGKICETDGTYLYDDEGNLTDELCVFTAGKTVQELKDNARAGKGPGPSLQVYFRLADAPEALEGRKFKFFSGSWTALDAFGKIADQMAEAQYPVEFTLELEVISFKNKKGEEITYTKPVLTQTSFPEAANAEEPF